MQKALILGFGLVVWLPSVAGPPLVQQSAVGRTGGQTLDEAAAARVAREGRGLSAQQVAAFEDRIQRVPDDLIARVRLLGFYFSSASRATSPEAARAARRRHILWVIENHPESPLTRLPEFSIDPAGHPLADAEGYRLAKAAWLQQIERRKDDVGILRNAARFFQLADKALATRTLKQALEVAPADNDVAMHLGYVYAISALGIVQINNNGLPMAAEPREAAGDVGKAAVAELRSATSPTVIAVAAGVLSQYGAIVQVLTKGAINRDALAEELLVRSVALNPGDPGARESLAQFYSLRVSGARSPQERAGFARKALEQLDAVLAAPTVDRDARVYALIGASKMAIEAAALAKARAYATELLEAVASDRSSGFYGQAVHDGNVVLGRVALRENNVEQAKSYLLQAGRTPGGGPLDSFGPNMSLAKELAERGERETVVAYLESCRSFWRASQLDQWIQTLRAGRVPNFGANLAY